MAVQYVKAAGFETIAVSSSKHKEEWEYKLGADKIVYSAIGLKAAGEAQT